MPPRLPRRNEMKAGPGFGFCVREFYKDFAPDGAAERGSATRSVLDGSESMNVR